MADNNEIKYWKALEEYKQDPEFEQEKHHEFAEHLPIDDVISENDMELKSNRRDFLKFMGFGISAATLAACSRSPVKKAIPYVDQPVEMTPGIADYYAATSFASNEGAPLLVKTREGRPIKIEGNNKSSLTNGGTSAVDQASVLSLYDDTRLKGPAKNKNQADWDSIDQEISDQLKEIADRGGNIRILSNTIHSPSTKNAIEDFKKQYPTTQHITYDAVSSYAVIKANKEAFSQPYIPDYKFDKAKTIVGINADFLGTWIAPVEFTKKYAEGRNIDKYNDMSFHMQIESTLSLTGSNADFRAPVKPSQEGLAVIALYNEVAKKAGAAQLPNPNFDLAANAIKVAAKELWAHKGKGIVVSGSNDYNIQLIVNKINSLLENYGSTINFEHASLQKQGNDEDMVNLVNEMNQGKVDALIVYGANPTYDYFDSKRFTEGMKQVGLSISFNDHMDETTKHATYVCPDHHFLEAWNDAQPKLGHFSLSQPTIQPIFNTRAAQESLLKWAGNDQDYHDYIKSYWQQNLYAESSETQNFRNFWIKCVHDGIFEANPNTTLNTGADTAMAGNASNGSNPAYNNFKKDLSKQANALMKQSKNASGIELVLYEKVGIREGKSANNPWLQEFPDPISKVTWDNYACVSPKMAEENGLSDEDVIQISAGGHKVELPVFTLPGQPHGTIALAVGYGRFLGSENGKVANNRGKNTYPFISVGNNNFKYYATGASFKATGEQYQLASTQTHHHIEDRDLIREASKTEYQQDPKSAQHSSHHLISLYKDYNYGKGHHWAMAIDMNACTGCGACVISCQAENNVPVVGKQEVRRRREMHWIRIDRYFSKDPENPNVNFQPMMCQHCDNAPCENVCPVAAISHSSEGINQQIYNRCVGTRYCANNCPFKVRRFNWYKYTENDNFDYNQNSDLGRMVLNPDVTVRSRGVMEKCSFCVQRIQSAKLESKKKGEALQDGEVKTACQTACPANAIKFGDLNDPNSEVAQLMNENYRSYGLLTYTGIKPTVNYMAKVRNDKTEDQEA